MKQYVDKKKLEIHKEGQSTYRLEDKGLNRRIESLNNIYRSIKKNNGDKKIGSVSQLCDFRIQLL